MRKLYQMVASGSRVSTGDRAQMMSKRVFFNLPSEEEKEAFKGRCCGEGLSDLDEGDTKITVIELELVDEEEDRQNEATAQIAARLTKHKRWCLTEHDVEGLPACDCGADEGIEKPCPPHRSHLA